MLSALLQGLLWSLFFTSTAVVSYCNRLKLKPPKLPVVEFLVEE